MQFMVTQADLLIRVADFSLELPLCEIRQGCLGQTRHRHRSEHLQTESSQQPLLKFRTHTLVTAACTQRNRCPRMAEATHCT
jgi:hypothetical protein